jgi:hypothetical protein
MRARRRTFLLAALLLLASFGALTLEESFVHTDDGCPVETHCLACRWAYGATGMAVAALDLAIGIRLLEPIVATPSAAPAEPPPLASESRGPPLPS